MSDVHAGPLEPTVEGRCTWRHHYEDVDLACTDVVVFGQVYCSDHLEWVAELTRGDADDE